MCRSVPQMPARSTRISTSLMPIWGRGTSRIHRPGLASCLTSAFIVAFIDHPDCFSLSAPVESAGVGVAKPARAHFSRQARLTDSRYGFPVCKNDKDWGLGLLGRAGASLRVRADRAFGPGCHPRLAGAQDTRTAPREGGPSR